MNDRVKDPWHPYPEAPDITPVLKSARATFNGIIVTSLFGGGIDAMPAVGLFRNMTRLLVRACEEYQAAIKQIVLAIEGRGPAPIIYAASHWEGCVEALHRAVAMAEVFRVQLGKWAPDEQHLRIDKSARFTQDELKPIEELRHAAQHLDTELGKYQAKPGETDRSTGIFIDSSATGIAFHGHKISYEQLAKIMGRLGDLCTWLHMQEIPAGHPLAHPDRKVSVKVEGAAAYRKPFGT